MKTAIVYYSLTGNAERIARQIAGILGADLIPLVPSKAYPDAGLRMFFWGGKSAVMAEAPALEPYSFDPDAYDCVVMGTPVWAGTYTPPLRSFLLQNREALGTKKLAAFVCSGGGSTDKAFRKLRETAGVDRFAAELSLMDPQASDEERRGQIEAFCRQIG